MTKKDLMKILLKLFVEIIPIKKYRRKAKQLIGVRENYKPKKYYGSRKIHYSNEAQSMILKKLQEGKPCLIARFGGTELANVTHYLQEGNFTKGKKAKKLRNKISDLSGFFPANNKNIVKFCKEHLRIVGNVDIMAVWNNRFYEEDILNKYCLNASLIGLEDLTPIYYKEPWSQHLKGKKVLVIHPFKTSFEKQYKIREKLFNNPKILPEFNLITLKAVQSLADNKKDLPYNSWFTALEYMKRKIDKIDFDVAIIGAGAYGMFLGEYCKSIGKQAIHLGGVTQMLFGVYGSKWENDPVVNKHWIKPLKEETPAGAKKVERACYW